MDDPLNTLFTRFRPSAKMAFSGTVCGMLNDQHEVELGHLHLMRAGALCRFVWNAPASFR